MKKRSQLMQNNSQEILDRYKQSSQTTGETVEERSDDPVLEGVRKAGVQNINDGVDAVKELFSSDDEKPEEKK